MNQHDSASHEAARLARRAAFLRGVGRTAEAERAEERALALVGYQAPSVRLPSSAWTPSVNDRLPVARKLVGIALGLALALGLTARAEACPSDQFVERQAAASEKGAPDEVAYSRAVEWCEAADMPGTYEWATVRANICPDVSATAWVEQDERGMWFAACGNDDGVAWLEVRP